MNALSYEEFEERCEAFPALFHLKGKGARKFYVSISSSWCLPFDDETAFTLSVSEQIDGTDERGATRKSVHYGTFTEEQLTAAIA